MILITAIIEDYEFTIYLSREDERKLLNSLERRGIKYRVIRY